MNFSFHLATPEDGALIQQWWSKPYVIEFWDNSPEMWQNVENYLQGKKDLFDYWIGYYDKTPFALIMTSEIDKHISPTEFMFPWIEADKLNITLDFMIGEEAFLGKNLAHQALNHFCRYLSALYGAGIFIIDPAVANIKAVRAYQRAGFEIVNSFTRDKEFFAGIKHYLMRMKL